MTKKFTIKRKKRFFENTQFKLFTGFMFVSNYLPKERNPSKPIGLNNTTLYLYKNNFCLLDKFIKYEEVSQFLIDKYGIEENKIFSINKVFLKGTKVIYLVYLDFKTKINNFYEYRTLNMFQKKNYNDPETQDLYQAIYNNNKCTDFKSYKIFFDENNFVETSINTIFYYLIGISR